MMQRLFNLNKWTLLLEGQQISYANKRPRTVRLLVNAPSKVQLTAITADGEPQFLALVEGTDAIEFVTDGQMGLTVEGGEVWIYTADSDDISLVAVDPVSFTKIMERRARNPEFERLMYLAQRNVERRFEEQAAQLEQLLSRRLAAVKREPAPSVVPASVGTQSSPDGGNGSSDSSAPAPTGRG